MIVPIAPQHAASPKANAAPAAPGDFAQVLKAVPGAAPPTKEEPEAVPAPGTVPCPSKGEQPQIGDGAQPAPAESPVSNAESGSTPSTDSTTSDCPDQPADEKPASRQSAGQPPATPPLPTAIALPAQQEAMPPDAPAPRKAATRSVEIATTATFRDATPNFETPLGPQPLGPPQHLSIARPPFTLPPPDPHHAADVLIAYNARDIAALATGDALRFHMRPDTLGPVAVSIEGDARGQALHLTVDRPAAYAAIREAQPQLAHLAEQRGATLTEVRVDLNAPSGGGRHTRPQRPPPADSPATPPEPLNTPIERTGLYA